MDNHEGDKMTKGLRKLGQQERWPKVIKRWWQMKIRFLQWRLINNTNCDLRLSLIVVNWFDSVCQQRTLGKKKQRKLKRVEKVFHSFYFNQRVTI